MDPQQAFDSVIRFYQNHPINEEQILGALKAKGIDPVRATENDLKAFDQDHYGGIPALEGLMREAGITNRHHVLDVCSGMGGPARWIAHRVGCRVTGLDLTLSRVESARRLTQRVKLEQRVHFVQGDATAMPLPSAKYDAVIAQEAWVHIADKRRLVAECARVLVPSGRLAFTDIVARRPLSAEQTAGLVWAIEAAQAVEPATYVSLLSESGFEVESNQDLSTEWTALLVDRLAMYRSLRDTTVARFGASHFDDWDRRYSYFVGLFTSAVLGGVRIAAQRSTA
jgi:ubiquinone/menaquinone biosynthesis C-methylase UbiE